MKRRAFGGLAGVLLGPWIAAGCNDNSSEPAPNQPPITEITSGPAEGSRVPCQSTFFFRGSDYDGTVREFDWLLDPQPRSAVVYTDVVPRTPAANDPRWTRITGYQVALTALADTLRDPPLGPNGSGEFDRWHTFYVRAVDNEGAVDSRPLARTFQAFTQAPVLQLLSPVRAGSTVTLPRTFIMNWDGVDAIGSGAPFQAPRESRWVLLPATLDGLGNPVGFPQALYDLPESAWSPWVAWAATDSSGRELAFRDKVPPGPNTSAFVFAVQGRDDAGAITAEFQRDGATHNNYSAFVVDGNLPVGPRITVHAREESLSAWTFAGNPAPQIDVFTTVDTVRLFWDPPNGSSYGAWARECRYGWNIDPTDELQWTPWGTGRTAARQPLRPTGDVFRIQCRDQLGQVTSGVLVFQPTRKSYDATDARAPAAGAASLGPDRRRGVGG